MKVYALCLYIAITNLAFLPFFLHLSATEPGSTPTDSITKHSSKQLNVLLCNNEWVVALAGQT